MDDDYHLVMCATCPKPWGFRTFASVRICCVALDVFIVSYHVVLQEMIEKAIYLGCISMCLVNRPFAELMGCHISQNANKSENLTPNKIHLEFPFRPKRFWKTHRIMSFGETQETSVAVVKWWEMSLCLGKFEDRPTMPYSTPPGEEDLEYVSEELPDPKSLDFFLGVS